MASNHRALYGISELQKLQLKRGGISDLTELLSASPKDIAKKAKISVKQIDDIIRIACEASPSPSIRQLGDVKHEGTDVCTTGDSMLDAALDGGIRTGMIWEIVGESAAGKTQLALQLSLLVQLPRSKGGLDGSACYLTTSSKLPTSRLLQIATAHPLLTSANSSLAHVHTISTPTIPILLRVLSEVLPNFINERSQSPSSKPVRVLVVDALAELFHSSDKTTTSTLAERSQNIAEISTLLHGLASSRNLAVLVLNEVTDVFNHAYSSTSEQPELVYSEQSRWFGRAETVPGEGRKEASLGLVWANQVNSRILLTRTGRRRYVEIVGASGNKRQRLDAQPLESHQHQDADQLTVIRRLSVIFSSVVAPVSLDYIVTSAGISVLPEDENQVGPVRAVDLPLAEAKPPTPAPYPSSQLSQFAPLDVGHIEATREETEQGERAEDGAPEDDEWDRYWQDNELSDELVGTLAE